jgi:thiamine biosynthesis lipoprotein ApbE
LTSSGLSPIYGYKAQARLFSSDAVIEVSEASRSQAELAIRQAFEALRRAEFNLTLIPDASATPGPIAHLQATADSGEETHLSQEILQFLSRTLDFCLWSDGAHGPLGAPLYDLRAGRQVDLPGSTNPNLRAVLDLVDCRRLMLDRDASTGKLEAGTRLDLRGFQHGYAVDRGVEALKENGITSGVIRIGSVTRGFGVGSDKRGWRVDLPALSPLSLNNFSVDLWIRALKLG